MVKDLAERQRLLKELMEFKWLIKRLGKEVPMRERVNRVYMAG